MKPATPASRRGDANPKLLKEGVTSTPKKDARENNLYAVQLVSALMKTSLGPMAMDKMFVSNIGVITVTNDGFSMIKEMDVHHPAAMVLKDLAWITNSSVGDGTVSAVVLAGALLEKGNELIKQGVHASQVARGYRIAARAAVQVLEGIAEKVDTSDKDALARIAKISLKGRVFSIYTDHVARVAVEAALAVAEVRDGRYTVDVKDIIMEKKDGATLLETRMIHGRILEQKFGIPEMPRRIENARIALFNIPFKVEKTEVVSRQKSKVTITDPKMMQRFLDQDTAMVKAMVDKVRAVGANVAITDKENSPMAQYYLAKAGIMSIQKVQDVQIPTVAKMTGATVVTSFDDLREEDLGYAELVEERDIDTKESSPLVLPNHMVFLEGCKNPKAVTIFVRGGTKKVVNEAERSIKDALLIVKDVLEDPRVVVGGGAAEAEAAFQLGRMATKLEAREQLAVQKFAEALEEIPRALAENAGLDGVNAMTELRSRHSNGGKWYGVAASPGRIKDMHAEQVFEPLAVKRQVIRAAAESAATLLRVDWVMIKPNKKKTAFLGGSQG